MVSTLGNGRVWALLLLVAILNGNTTLSIVVGDPKYTSWSRLHLPRSSGLSAVSIILRRTNDFCQSLYILFRKNGVATTARRRHKGLGLIVLELSIQGLAVGLNAKTVICRASTTWHDIITNNYSFFHQRLNLTPDIEF